METPSSALPAGTQLKSPTNVYNIIKVLGAGGFGITYLATVDIIAAGVPAKALVAIKEHFLSNDCDRDNATLSVSYSRPSASRVQNSLKDFIAEARRLQTIAGKHRGIVNVSEVFEANNTAYYVMEYLHGTSLNEYVKQHTGGLSAAEAMQIIIPVVDAVAFLHVNRITHLDIKPANIMLSKTADGALNPTLIDFGLSKHYNSDGSATATINTLGFSDGYSPVEQYIGISEFSPTADVYSLAATLLFCLTGSIPPKSNEISADVVNSLLPASMPKSLRRAISKATSMRIAERYANASQLYEALTGRKLQHSPLSTEIEDKKCTDQQECETTIANENSETDNTSVQVPDDDESTVVSIKSKKHEQKADLTTDLSDIDILTGKHDDKKTEKESRRKQTDTDSGGIHSQSENSNNGDKMRKWTMAIVIVLISAALGAGCWYWFFNGDNGDSESMAADAERYVQLEEEVNEAFQNHEYNPEAYNEAAYEFEEFKRKMSRRYNTPSLENEFESACREERNK